VSRDRPHILFAARDPASHANPCGVSTGAPL
jgi:hypothetical protein